MTVGEQIAALTRPMNDRDAVIVRLVFERCLEAVKASSALMCADPVSSAHPVMAVEVPPPPAVEMPVTLEEKEEIDGDAQES